MMQGVGAARDEAARPEALLLEALRPEHAGTSPVRASIRAPAPALVPAGPVHLQIALDPAILQRQSATWD